MHLYQHFIKKRTSFHPFSSSSYCFSFFLSLSLNLRAPKKKKDRFREKASDWDNNDYYPIFIYVFSLSFSILPLAKPFACPSTSFSFISSYLHLFFYLPHSLIIFRQNDTKETRQNCSLFSSFFYTIFIYIYIYRKAIINLSFYLFFFAFSLSLFFLPDSHHDNDAFPHHHTYTLTY